jgi:CTP:molybdopterin cytidylyltransferase MocA
VRVAGLVLAAGEGRRLGTPKALVEVGGQRLVDRAVTALRLGGSDPVLVVLGAAPVDVPGAHVVTNDDWRTGMGSSLRLGLAALDEVDATAVVVTLVDTPGVTGSVVDRLVAACAAGADVAVATYDGRPRTPVLLTRAHWPEAAEMAVGDVGARAFLGAHPHLVRHVECGGVGAPDDIDTPEDLARFTS